MANNVKRQVYNNAKLTESERNRRKIVRKRKRTSKIFRVLIFLLIMSIGILVSVTVLFKTSEIVITGNTELKTQEIAVAGEIKETDSLLFLNTTETENKIKEKFPTLKVIKVKKELPNKVIVNLEDSVSIYSIMIDTEYAVIDSRGCVVSRSKDYQEEYPIVLGALATSALLGEEIIFIDKDHKDILDKIVGALHNTELKVESIDVSKLMNIKMKYNDNITIQIGSSEDVEEKLKLGKIIINEKITDTEVGIIDLQTPQTARFIPSHDNN